MDALRRGDSRRPRRRRRLRPPRQRERRRRQDPALAQMDGHRDAGAGARLLCGLGSRAFTRTTRAASFSRRTRRRSIVPATGYEVGARVRPLPGLDLAAAAFLLDLDSELVLDGDTGTTDAIGPHTSLRPRADRTLASRRLALRRRRRDVHARRVPGERGQRQRAWRSRRRGRSPRGWARCASSDEWTPFGSVRVKSIADRPANAGRLARRQRATRSSTRRPARAGATGARRRRAQPPEHDMARGPVRDDLAARMPNRRP